MRRNTALAALVLAIAALGGGAAAAAPRTYAVDRNHSNVKFQIRHIVSMVDGRFTEFDGRVTYDPQAPQSSTVELVVQAASIDTDHPKRDDHLRSPDFFEVDKHPVLSFRSVAVEPESASSLRVTGDLTIKGVTRRVTVPVRLLGTAPFRGGEKAGFQTSFTIDRKEFGVTWNRAIDQGGMLLGDEVEISIQLEADWKPAAAPAAAS